MGNNIYIYILYIYIIYIYIYNSIYKIIGSLQNMDYLT